VAYPNSFLAYPNGVGHPMIPTYTTSVGLPKICLAFDWPTQMKIPRTAPERRQNTTEQLLWHCGIPQELSSILFNSTKIHVRVQQWVCISYNLYISDKK